MDHCEDYFLVSSLYMDINESGGQGATARQTASRQLVTAALRGLLLIVIWVSLLWGH
jgi:hypothetical protein